MKTGKFSFIFNGLCALIFSMFTLTSSGQVLDSSIVKTRDLKKEDIIFLESSIGDINVKTWNKNELRVEYIIYAEAKSQKELSSFRNKFKQAIEDQIKNNDQGKVYASMPFNTIQINGSSVKMTFKGDNEKFELKELRCTLLVSMPEVNSLNLRSSFNKVSIENLNSDVTIEINSTHFKMGDCKSLNLKANFSKDMEIGNIGSALLNINSCDLKTGRIETDLSLKSNFSHIEIEKIGNKADLVLNSSSFETTDIKKLNFKGNFVRNFKANTIDSAKISLTSSEFEVDKISRIDIDRTSFSNFRIGEADNIQIGASSSSKFLIDQVNSIESPSCSFSSFNINNLKNRFKTTAHSGNVQIKHIFSGFDEININGSFVDIDMHVAENSNYLISADLTFPNYNFSDLVYENHEKDISHELIIGSKGNKQLASSKINLLCQSCKITIN
jgi:hypothetical protein